MPTKTTVDLVTLFDQDRGLTTASTKDGLFFPFPSGTYVEGFTRMSMDERWQQHLETERYLEREVGAVRCVQPREFEQMFLRAIRKQMLYVRTIRLWYLKTVYWYLIRRRKLANKSIEQQHREGLIELDDPVYDVEVM